MSSEVGLTRTDFTHSMFYACREHSVFYACRELLKCFVTSEIIQWKPFCQQFESELKFGSAGSPATNVFNTKLEGGTKRWGDLKNRVVEHVSSGTLH